MEGRILLLVPLAAEGLLDLFEVVLEVLLATLLVLEEDPDFEEVVVEALGRLQEADIDLARHGVGDLEGLLEHAVVQLDDVRHEPARDLPLLLRRLLEGLDVLLGGPHDELLQRLLLALRELLQLHLRLLLVQFRVSALAVDRLLLQADVLDLIEHDLLLCESTERRQLE